MQKFEFLEYKIKSKIAHICINRPPINAFNIQLLDEILNALKMAQNDANVRVVLIKSELEKIFLFCRREIFNYLKLYPLQI